MFNKQWDKWLDKRHFDKHIKEKFGMEKSTLKILKESEDKDLWLRLFEKTKLYIATTSLMATTKEGIQRRNNWIECLNYMQNMLKDKEIKDKTTDYRTMKKK